MNQVSAIVLAAGFSTRMHTGQKLFHSFRGKMLIEHVLDNLRGSVHEIVLVGKTGDRKLLEKAAKGNAEIVSNETPEKGLTSSIQKGISSLKREGTGYMICLGDMPLISREDYIWISEMFCLSHSKNHKTITAPFFQNKKGNPVIFSSFYREELLSNKEPGGCKNIVEKHDDQLIRIDMNTPVILQDIDTVEDLKRLN